MDVTDVSRRSAVGVPVDHGATPNAAVPLASNPKKDRRFTTPPLVKWK
jgi:hypothetical protein